MPNGSETNYLGVPEQKIDKLFGFAQMVLGGIYEHYGSVLWFKAKNYATSASMRYSTSTLEN